MSPAGSPRDQLLGRRLAGRYRIAAVIARGGMATVYRAVDERLERPVALKVLADRYAVDAEFAERFLAEARTAASFSHPNLAHVYDSGSDDGAHFIALELLDGHRSLREEIRDRGRLEPLRAALVVRDVLAGLEQLHGRGMVHCDVKSGNVMIGPSTKLIDFGIARPLRHASSGRTSIGSLHAMSPEQLRGEPLTAASDLFAVGVVLYEALSGRVPFPGDTPEAVAMAHDTGSVPAPSDLAPGIASRLDDVVLQALRREPRGRFASARAMRTALDSAIRAQRTLDAEHRSDDTTAMVTVPTADRPPEAAVLSPASATRRDDGRRPALVAASLVAATALGALLVAVLLLGPRQTDGSATPTVTGAATSAATPTLAPGTVRVPDTVGMSEAEAEAAARAAGLAWRIEWRIVPGQTPGIYDQEPPAGRVVETGSRFVMYAYRSQ